ncbi:MAG: Rpp14/Pop5 family protein [Nanoarchaeota archaeon]|nr:Rpp14/Pop5 family protein [Nanoarchaeota archaeon]
MKPLLPTLKENQRYIVYEVLSQTPLTEKEIMHGITQGLKEFLGVLGLATSGAVLMKALMTKGIIRTNSKHVDHIKAALAYVKHINQQPVVVRSIGVSGLYNKAEELCS